MSEFETKIVDCKTLEPKALSEWKCHLFGGNGAGISFRPLKEDEPNWFWRKMQYLILGNKWVKDK